MQKHTIKTISLILVLALCLSVPAMATEARASGAKASLYISACSGAATAIGSGKVTVSFSITGKSKMTELGVTQIAIKNPSGQTVKTYFYTDSGCSSMMGYNKTLHNGSVTYQGVSGNTYYAVIYFRATNANGSDTDMYTTYTVIA